MCHNVPRVVDGLFLSISNSCIDIECDFPFSGDVETPACACSKPLSATSLPLHCHKHWSTEIDAKWPAIIVEMERKQTLLWNMYIFYYFVIFIIKPLIDYWISFPFPNDMAPNWFSMISCCILVPWDFLTGMFSDTKQMQLYFFFGFFFFGHNSNSLPECLHSL